MISKTTFCIIFIFAFVWFIAAMAYTYTTAIKDFIALKRDMSAKKAAAGRAASDSDSN